MMDRNQQTNQTIPINPGGGLLETSCGTHPPAHSPMLRHMSFTHHPPKLRSPTGNVPSDGPSPPLPVSPVLPALHLPAGEFFHQLTHLDEDLVLLPDLQAMQRLSQGGLQPGAGYIAAAAGCPGTKTPSAGGSTLQVPPLPHQGRHRLR